MKTIYKILGKKGRTTIPQDIRTACGFKSGDIISFETRRDGTVLLRKESICDHCRNRAPVGIFRYFAGTEKRK